MATKKATRKKTPEKPVSVASTGDRKWYAVRLANRGPNVNLVKLIEIEAGGDPSASLPYEVSAYLSPAPADYLCSKLLAAGATANVLEV